MIVPVGEIKFLNLSSCYLRNDTILWCILIFCFIRHQYVDDLAESTDSSGYVQLECIPTEVWKHGGDNLFGKLHQLVINAWEVGSVPQAWKDASIVTIYKNGDRTDCGNCREISLLSIAGKTIARILLNRLSTHITPEVVPETQCDFSTVDMIFFLRQLQKSALSRTDHCTWYLSTSVRLSLQLGGPGYGSY